MTHLILWLVTLAGLFPIVFLCAWSLIREPSLAHSERQFAESGARLPKDDDLIGFGRLTAKFYLTERRWPPILILCGVVLVLAGMFSFIPRKPQRFYRNGLSMIGYHVRRVLNSRDRYESVKIATPDGAHAVVFSRVGARALVGVFANPSDGNTLRLQTDIGLFFKSRGITPSGEFMPYSMNTDDSICRLEASLGLDPRADSELILALFRDVFGLSDSAGLEFTATRRP